MPDPFYPAFFLAISLLFHSALENFIKHHPIRITL